VSKAEHGIQTIKEHTRGVIATLPFENIPRQMKIEFVYFTVLWLNACKAGYWRYTHLGNSWCNGSWIIRGIAGWSPEHTAGYMMSHRLRTQ
jgi:hypothetical protein